MRAHIGLDTGPVALDEVQLTVELWPEVDQMPRRSDNFSQPLTLRGKIRLLRKKLRSGGGSKALGPQATF